MTQLNTPYPATAYLTGFLRLHEARLGFTVTQADPALEQAASYSSGKLPPRISRQGRLRLRRAGADVFAGP